MHTTSEMGTGVAAFLAKLWKMVEDPKTNEFISWSPTGKSFIIRNQSTFSELLSHYYKHSNMASFIRQLNMYGFHKIVSVELGGLKCEKDEIEFAHQYFCKGFPNLLEKIKRKVACNKSQTAQTPIKPEVFNKMLIEAKTMKTRQDTMDSTLNNIKLENATLWRELAMLRQKHLKQQQIINKLVQFLVTLVHPSRNGLSVKRRYPLMINDSSRPHKQRKLSKQQDSPMGPVIHELDASDLDMDSDYIVAEMLENESPTVQSPQERIEVPTDDENTETVELDPLQLDPLQNRKIEKEVKKKHVCKGKKKRKNEMPVKIFIPSWENGKKPSEELLETSTDEDESLMTLLKNDSIGSKPIPTATMRSSKLAAMAANIKSEDDNDLDMNSPLELEDNMETLDNNTSMKLKDILTIPDVLNNSNIQDNIENREDSNSNPKKTNRLNQLDDDRSVSVTHNNEQFNENRMVKSSQKENNSCDRANPCSSKDLSVSCINSSGMSEANYRLEPTDEMDTHLVTMQNDLDNLRQMFYNENCSIDANTILGLFNEDPMAYDLPMNSELNPNCGNNYGDDDPKISDFGGELITYNPSSNLLELDDDTLLQTASSLSNPSDLQMNSLYATNPLDEEETEASLLEVLMANNANAKS